LPGVGTAYKLVEALYDGHDTHAYLDLVALGIVADVATLTGDTRYLLQLGLDVLRETTRPGLRAVYERTQINPGEISEQHISFTLGPRLNALGRLADANPAVELLTSHDPTQVDVLAAQLEGFNNERKLQMNQVYGAAKALIEKDPSVLDDAALVLGHPDWPGGIVGIVASRLADEYNRPVILLTTPEGEAARGSARSVDGCDITAAIAAHSDLLLTYGGHTAAAGLSLDPANLPDFRRGLSRTVRGMLGKVETRPTLAVDGYVKLASLSLDLVRDVERLAPFGPGNAALTLATRGVKINRQTIIGRRSEHLSLVVEDSEGTTHKVLWWQANEDELPQGRFDLAYTVRASDYKGRREVMVEWVDARPADDGLIDLDGGVVEMEAEDYRLVSDPHFILQQLQQEQPDLLIWREVVTDVEGVTRSDLQRSPALAVWTVPPGNAEWQAALQIVLPRTVYLFGHDPGLDTLPPFVKRLGGLVKHVLNARDGLADLDQLAAAMAHRAATVRAGLDWLAAQGSIQITDADGQLCLTTG
ncbi:MAG: DHH family phosphoesterase, partial [Anaerolineae bacterium]|nr:DHH family phosphoesterase [Anaerolineae bacterium]